MIVKIQRPVATTDGEPRLYAYDRNRRFEAFLPWTPDLDHLFADGSYKVYHVARERNGKLEIGRRVEEPDW